MTAFPGERQSALLALGHCQQGPACAVDEQRKDGSFLAELLVALTKQELAAEIRDGL